ncbi:Larval cuticle protein 1 [Gryllus bimaculatus]|nr:Larval cuticle protein 1 [Gryllus bimaculatus]
MQAGGWAGSGGGGGGGRVGRGGGGWGGVAWAPAAPIGDEPRGISQPGTGGAPGPCRPLRPGGPCGPCGAAAVYIAAGGAGTGTDALEHLRDSTASDSLHLRSAMNTRPEEIPIIKSEYNLNPDGSYQWNYETGNGIKAQETGSLEPADDPKDGNVVVAQGGFSYTGDDGTPISLSYRADKGGFQPEGAHLPTPPPIV